MGKFYHLYWAEVTITSSRLKPKPTMEMVIEVIGVADGRVTLEHDGIFVPIEVSGNEIEIGIRVIEGDLKRVCIPCVMHDEGTLSDTRWKRIPFIPIEAEIGDCVLKFSSNDDGVWQTICYLSSLPETNKITQIWKTKQM